MFKYAVDILTADPTGATAASTPLVALMPATLLLGYGAARAGSALFNELRNAVFAKASPLLKCLAVIVAAQHSTAQHSTAQHSTAQHSTAQHSTAQHSTAQHSTAQHSTAQHSTASLTEFS